MAEGGSAVTDVEREQKSLAAQAVLLREWLGRLESRAVAARESAQPMTPVLLSNLEFTRHQLARVERQAFELRERLRTKR